MKDDFEKQMVVMSDEAKREKAGELERKVNEMQQLYVQLQKDLPEREREMMKVIFDKMEAVIKDIADGRGLHMSSSSRTPGSWWPRRPPDITNELVRKYNAKYAKAGAPPRQEGRRQEGRPRRSEGGHEVGGRPCIFRLAELAARVGGEVEGDGDRPHRGVAAARGGRPGQSPSSRTGSTAAPSRPPGPARWWSSEEEVPAGAHGAARAERLPGLRQDLDPLPPAARAGARGRAGGGGPSRARVDPSARGHALASVGPGAEIGARTILFPGVAVGDGARVGDDCILHPNVVVRERCIVGNRVILQPGAVMGSDGFGFAFDMEGDGQGPRHFKVPQSGIVVVEDDVEIGANTCVDRATLGVTRIGARAQDRQPGPDRPQRARSGPLSCWSRRWASPGRPGWAWA